MKKEYEKLFEKEREEDYEQQSIYRSWSSDRKAVCKKCKYAIPDGEPLQYGGEFYHPKEDKSGKIIDCVNAGETFVIGDKEIEPFVRKRLRRLDKRNFKRNKR